MAVSRLHAAGNACSPWLNLMPPSYWEDSERFSHGLDVFEDALARSPDGPAIHYFDGSLTYRQLDEESDALASELQHGGFMRGDRLAVFVQNIPAFPIAMVAAWKAGGVLVPVNPMSRPRELAIVLNDAQPYVLMLEPEFLQQCYNLLPDDCFRPDIVLLASPHDYQTRDDMRVLPPRTEICGTRLLRDVVRSRRGETPAKRVRAPTDAAFMVYTSGTTGVPRAAVIPHDATARASTYARKAYGLQYGEPVMALAPIFHVTGIMSTLMTALYLGSPVIFTHRFQPEVSVDAVREYRPVFTAASPTAYIALTQANGAVIDDFRSFRACAIGGAAVSPALLKRLLSEFGVPAQTGFGMTETGGAVAITPIELRGQTPIDPASGALSIGLPLPGVEIWIASDEGVRLQPGQTGEIVICAPTMMAAYWRKPEATAEALRADGLRTGDVGFMDENGWFYLVDRKKDMIVAAGYKVWPREIEDVLYAHPSVLEAAVIGVPDAYRGETVKAFVRIRPGTSASIPELREYCRSTLAAYKRPSSIVIVDDMPKTASGKIMRAALRARMDAA